MRSLHPRFIRQHRLEGNPVFSVAVFGWLSAGKPTRMLPESFVESDPEQTFNSSGLPTLFQWLCEFTRAGNEELRQRAEGAILQRDDRRRIGNCWNICWQQLQG